MRPNIPPPSSKDELWQRAEQLAGLTLHDIAQAMGCPVPQDLRRHKGWAGQLIEHALGAHAGSLSLPDFPKLGIELKTLPLGGDFQPKETTFVCSIALSTVHKERWFSSSVFQKTQQVLWVPLQGDNRIPLKDRRIYTPFFWTPNTEEATILRFDWEMLTDAISLGRLNHLSARDGQWLHIRPKGANRKALTWAIDEHGQRVQTLPRGFYLRTELTRRLLAARFS